MLEIYKECRESGLLTNKTPSNEIKTIQQETEKYDNREEIMSKNSSNKFNIADFVISKLHTRYIRSLLAKPFVILTGNSGTGKTRIATKFAEYMKQDDNLSNSLLVPVGADWTDNTKILGYYNPLANNGTGKYEKTPMLESGGNRHLESGRINQF